MACSLEKQHLIHRVLDDEATEQERHGLDEHLIHCVICRNGYSDLKEVEGRLFELELPDVSSDFTEKVMARLPKQSKINLSSWLKAHPILVSAACFIVLMLGYVFSLGQDHTFKAEVIKGNGKLSYSGVHTVIVPKNEIIKGDLVIENGNVRIDGKVEGNVILVNSHSLMASAGQVTGHVEQVNRALGWVWYQIKQQVQQTL